MVPISQNFSTIKFFTRGLISSLGLGNVRASLYLLAFSCFYYFQFAVPCGKLRCQFVRFSKILNIWYLRIFCCN